MSLSAEQTIKLPLMCCREHEILVACMIMVRKSFFFVIGYRRLYSTVTVLRVKPLVFGFL